MNMIYFETKKVLKSYKVFLMLFNNTDIILCLQGRSAYSKQTYGTKHPILLHDLSSYFTEFIIGDAHNNVLHQVIELRINIIFYAKKLLNFK